MKKRLPSGTMSDDAVGQSTRKKNGRGPTRKTSEKALGPLRVKKLYINSFREDIDEKIKLLEAEIKRLKEERKSHRPLRNDLKYFRKNYKKLALGKLGMAKEKERKVNNKLN